VFVRAPFLGEDGPRRGTQKDWGLVLNDLMTKEGD